MRKAKDRNKRKKNFMFITALVLMLALSVTIGYIAIKNSNLTPTAQSGETDQSNTSDKSTPIEVSPSDQSDTAEISPSTASISEITDPLLDKIATMSLEEKLGQLVIVGVDGYGNDANSKKLIEKYHVGGFILFKKNIQDAKQMLTLLNSLKETNTVNKLPLFLSVDEEGGRVSRMPEEFLKFPTNKVIGKLNDGNVSYQVGSIIGEELKAFGFNMDFAPVLDINSNPNNPVIGNRSFGTEASIVTKLGLQTMMGLQSQNVISVVKHFPGHGDTSIDSHVGLPKVNNDLERLTSFELVPFGAAIENNVDAIMVAHILLPKIDPDNPASFSKTIISDILRTEMNFNGVVITDDFTMGAIIKNYDIGVAAVKSIQAGTDIVLVCHGFDKQEIVINALKNAAATGELSKDRIDESVYRILALKQKYGISSEAATGLEAQVINDKIKELFK